MFDDIVYASLAGVIKARSANGPKQIIIVHLYANQAFGRNANRNFVT
jgi:hypothetical protein